MSNSDRPMPQNGLKFLFILYSATYITRRFIGTNRYHQPPLPYPKGKYRPNPVESGWGFPHGVSLPPRLTSPAPTKGQPSRKRPQCDFKPAFNYLRTWHDHCNCRFHQKVKGRKTFSKPYHSAIDNWTSIRERRTR
jgi:hypothetical protein